MIGVRVTGDRQVLAALSRMSEAGEEKALKEAITIAVEPVIASAKGRAPSSQVAEGVQLIGVEKDDTGAIVGEIGLPGGRRPWFYGLFVELGTGPRVQKSGRRTGSMPARPFLRPAFESESGNVRRLFFRHLRGVVMRARRG